MFTLMTKKYIFYSLVAFILGATTAHSQILSSGEVWSAYDVLDFENDSNNAGLSAMENSGSNSGTWNTNSAGGKFVADGAGVAVTDGDAGSWSRKIDYASPINSGKWRLELVISSYNFSNFDNMTSSSNGFFLRLEDGFNKFAEIELRIWDEVGSDGIAESVQGRMTGGAAGDFGQKSVSMDTANPVDNNVVYSDLAIEFDFATNVIAYYRNGALVDSSTFTRTQFDKLELEAGGEWAMSAADTGVLSTDLIGLYTAVPEPGSFALLGGCLALASVILRRRK